MNLDLFSATNFAKQIKANLKPEIQSKAYIACPFPYLYPLNEILKDSAVVLGCQNCHDQSHGAFTGEVSTKMIKDCGAKFVILGHSERRALFHEDAQWIKNKILRCLADGLEIIFCFGESLQDMQKGQTEAVIEKMLVDSLQTIAKKDMYKIVLAYEPIWAIGTGITPTIKQIESTANNIRKIVKQIWDFSIGENISLLYGGSCNPSISKDIFSIDAIDGGLIGGASLKVNDFMTLVNHNQ